MGSHNYGCTLGELIDALEAAPDKGFCPTIGLGKPHSYRGYYEELAFEPVSDATVAEMLDRAKSADGATYEGWKGGEFTMSRESYCWIAEMGEGFCGNPIGPVLRAYLTGDFAAYFARPR